MCLCVCVFEVASQGGSADRAWGPSPRRSDNVCGREAAQ